MFALQLRQRSLLASQTTGAVVGQSLWRHQEALMASSAEGKPPGSESPESSPSSTSAASRSRPAASQAITNADPSSAASSPGSPGTGGVPPPSDAARATTAAMQQLRNRLAATKAASASSTPQQSPGPDSKPPQQPASQIPQPQSQTARPTSLAASTPAPAPTAAPAANVANFQGLQLQLGTKDSPLQSMAVLTHAQPRQVEQYAEAQLESDQRLLAGLRKMTPEAQQRAGIVMRMASGAVPPPAVLVWASQQVVTQIRQLVLERLKKQKHGEEEQQPLASLQLEPWYEGAVQLARLTTPSLQQQQQQAPGASSSQPAPPQPRTDLDLLRSFAAAAGAPAGSPAPLFVHWEDLLSLPQLPALLDAAVARIPALQTTLVLTGLRPAADSGSAAASRSAEAEPGPSSSRAAAAAAAKGGGKQALVMGTGGSWLLPQLRMAVAAAREKALSAAGLLTAEGAAPLDADAVLTALALGAPPPAGYSFPSGVAAAAARRAAATEWLAAATLLRRAAVELGCAGAGGGDGAAGGGVRQEAVALLQLLGLPLEPPELPYMDELKVSEQQLRSWLAQAGAALAALPAVRSPAEAEAAAAAASPAAGGPTPPAMASALQAARKRLAAGGRALAILAPHPTVSRPGSSGPQQQQQTVAAAPLDEEAAATSAWLRTVGTPLATGLLSSGYDSLTRLRSMAPELREALVLRLLELGRAGGGVAALTAALYGDAEAAWRAAREEVAAAPAAAGMLRQEAVAAALDLVHERFVPPVPDVPPPPPLPTMADLAAAVAALPVAERNLYNSYFSLRPEDPAAAAAAIAAAVSKAASGGKDAARQDPLLGVLGALEAAGEGAAAKAAGGELQAWLGEVRKGLLTLPLPLLGLLLRFLRVQASITPEEAATQRNKLALLLTLVAEQQRRAVEAGGGGAGGAEAEAAAARQLGDWAAAGGGGRGSAGGALPGALAALLGSEGAQDFASWLQALTLTSRSLQSTHTLLAQQSTEMDVERYLTMSHDPRLSLPAAGLSGSAPATAADWQHPALHASEAAWLEDMRPQLDAYLQAMGHRRLGDAEWQVYKDAALAEWEAGSQEREERAKAAGESGFWNPRADELYLQQLLERNILPDDPLGPQSRRYLDTLIRNPSWTFVQRRRAVQRLIQLNTYFLRQPPAPADGSPFAPLFAVGGPDVVPQLGPLPDHGPEALGPGGAPAGGKVVGKPARR